MADTPRLCGHCVTARAVRHGARYGKYHPRDHTTEWFSTDEALVQLARLCRCRSAPEPEEVGRTVTAEIRRDGQRILRPGVNVVVQLKRATATKMDRGHVVECYDDGHVKVQLTGYTVVVPTDEWVRAREGTTEVAEAVL